MFIGELWEEMVITLQLLQFSLMFIYFVTGAEYLEKSLPLQEREANLKQNKIPPLSNHTNQWRKNDFKFTLGKSDVPVLAFNQPPDSEIKGFKSTVSKGIAKKTKVPILARWAPLYKAIDKEDDDIHIPSAIRRGTKIKYRFLYTVKPSVDLIDYMKKLILFFLSGKSSNFKIRNLRIPYHRQWKNQKQLPAIPTKATSTIHNKHNIIGLFLKKVRNDDRYSHRQLMTVSPHQGPVVRRRERLLKKPERKTVLRLQNVNRFTKQRQGPSKPIQGPKETSSQLGIQAKEIAELFYIGNWLSSRGEKRTEQGKKRNRKLDMIEAKKSNSTERKQPKEKEYSPFQRRYGRK